MKKSLTTILLISCILAFSANHFFENFDAGTTFPTPDGFTTDVANAAYINNIAPVYSAPNKAGINAATKWVATPFVSTAGTLTFYARSSSTSTSNYVMDIQKSYNGTDWTTVQSYPVGTFATADYALYTVNINDSNSNIQIRFYMSSRTGNSFYFDDVTLTDYFVCEGTDTTPPMWSGGETSGISISDFTFYTADVVWTDATDDSNPVSYDLYRSTASFTDTSVATLVVSSISDTTYTDIGLSPTTTYYYKIVARNCVPLTTLGNDTASLTTNAMPTIYEIQFNNTVIGGGTNDCYPSPYNGFPVTLTGLIQSLSNKGTYMVYTISQGTDPWNSLYVYDYDETRLLDIGDLVTVSGTISEYNGLSELGNVTAADTVGTDVQEPYSVASVNSIGGLGTWGAECGATTESYEGSLVILNDVYVVIATDGNKHSLIADTTTPIITLAMSDMLYSYSSLAAGCKLDTIVGVILYEDIGGTYYYTLNPRSADDIMLGCSDADITSPDWTVSGISNIDSTAVKETSVSLTWDAAIDAENPAVYYDLYRSPTSPVNTATATLLASDLVTNSYIDADLNYYTTYYYRIVTKNCVPLEKTASDELAVQTLNINFTDLCDAQNWDTNGNSQMLGHWIWVKGIASSETGIYGTSGKTSVYIEDSVQSETTCGINVYYSDGIIDIERGDDIIAYGKVTEYNGVTEVVISDTDPVLIAHTSSVVLEPELIATSLHLSSNWESAEAKEGKLTYVAGTVVDQYKGASYSRIRIRDTEDTDTGTNGLVVYWYDSTATITLTANDFTLGEYVVIRGVFTQYDSSSPYTTGYEIMPRDDADFTRYFKIAGQVKKFNPDYATKSDVPNLTVYLYENDSYMDILLDPNIVAETVTSNTGAFTFDDLSSGATYIVYPATVQDSMTAALSHYVNGITTGYYPVFKDLSDDITDVVIDMVEPVETMTPDDSEFDTNVTLEWELYTGNALDDNFAMPDTYTITYLIAISPADESGEMTLPPAIYTSLGIDATSYTNSFAPGEYLWTVFASSYDHPGTSGNTIPLSMSDRPQRFLVTSGEPPEIAGIVVADNRTLIVTFNEAVDTATATIEANYVVTPGSEIPATATKTNTNTVELVFSADFAAGDYLLTIGGVEDLDGNKIEWGAKNSDTFTIQETNLSNLKVYPNPIRLASVQTITFTGAGSGGKIKIYDAAGNLKYEDDYEGSVITIDLVEDAEFSSGIYFYSIETDIDKVIGKFAVVR